MNIKRLLLIVGVVNAIVLVAILGIFVFHSSRVNLQMEQMIKTDQALLLQMKDMHIHGLQTVTSLRNIMINPGDEKSRENYLKANQELMQSADEAIKLATGKIKDGLKQVKALWVEDHNLKMKAQELIKAGSMNEAKELITKKQTPNFREARAGLRDLIKEQSAVFAKGLEQNKKDMAERTWMLIIFIVLALLGFSTLLWFIYKSTQKNMSNALHCLSTLEQGDLAADHRIEDNSNFLKDIYNNIHASLRGMITKIRAASIDINNEVRDISDKINIVDTSSKEQLSQMDQVASATTEVSQTIIDVAKNASYASEAAKQATTIAVSGKDAVKKAVDAIGNIASSVKESSLTIDELGKSSKEIGDIVLVINDIADQTNLLALNAAIEAARAGEQGRGFAVVADEVRKLAERTGKATQEITDKITAIQKKAEASVEAMERSTKDAEGGVSLSDEAARALQEIVEATERALDMIQRIAVATEQQSSASEEIAQNMERITKLVNDNSRMVNESRELLGELDQRARSLDESVRWFKL
ncbi:MAG: methyl-accepting chemotaxis protein [Nitrospirae bacterium]|nr:methyl-accepting chemotaxis protein [Nitrospirota bacterium]